MIEEENRESVVLRVLTKEKDAKAIRDAITEVEMELGVSSEANVKKDETKFIPGLDVFLVAVATAFAKKFAERFGETFANWLARKLGLDKSKGEEIREPS